MNTNSIILAVVFTTVLIFLLIAVVFIVVLNARRERIKTIIANVALRLNYQQELRLAENEVQEQTLTYLAQELHDNLGQLLTVMKLQIEARKLDDAATAALLSPIDATLTDAVKELKLLSHSLNTDVVGQRGLLYAIEAEVGRLSRLPHVTITYSNDGTEPEINKDQCLMAFRIFQELLNNALKHAVASSIQVVMETKPHFSLCIKDNGRGFIPEEALLSAGGTGLRNIAKRAMMAGFDCSTQSAPGEGCSTKIILAASQPKRFHYA